MYTVFFISFFVSSTCFGCYFHPPSGAQLHLTIDVIPDPSECFRKSNLVSDAWFPYLTELTPCIDSKIDTSVPSIDKYIKSFVEATPSVNRKRFRITQMCTAPTTGCFGRCEHQYGVHRNHLGKLIMGTFIRFVSCERICRREMHWNVMILWIVT
jgi:hypothetical protein